MYKLTRFWSVQFKTYSYCVDCTLQTLANLYIITFSRTQQQNCLVWRILVSGLFIVGLSRVSTEVDFQFRGRKNSVKKNLTEVEISAMKISVLDGIRISVFRGKNSAEFREKKSAEFREKNTL